MTREDAVRDFCSKIFDNNVSNIAQTLFKDSIETDYDVIETL